MTILVNSDTRLLVQGITGSAGGFHASQCKAYGTKVVGGVTPGKGGQMFEGDGQDTAMDGDAYGGGSEDDEDTSFEFDDDGE